MRGESERGVEVTQADRFIHWATTELAAQCRMQARENLDPEYSSFMLAVAKRLIADDDHEIKPRQEQHSAACLVCGGDGWVCENHRDRSWQSGCCGGAGAPCGACSLEMASVGYVYRALEQAATNPTTGWRSDMENAPRDGTKILLWRRRRDRQTAMIGRWFNGVWAIGGASGAWPDDAFKFWMPIPAPPTTPPAGGEHGQG